MWRQWKTPRRRHEALIELGVRPRLASNTAGSGLGPWYLAKAKALSVGLSNAYFKSGFLRWSTSNGVTSRTAVYGPVRTVVWQGARRATAARCRSLRHVRPKRSQPGYRSNDLLLADAQARYVRARSRTASGGVAGKQGGREEFDSPKPAADSKRTRKQTATATGERVERSFAHF
jgi:hypothetical protein